MDAFHECATGWNVWQKEMAAYEMTILDIYQIVFVDNCQLYM